MLRGRFRWRLRLSGGQGQITPSPVNHEEASDFILAVIRGQWVVLSYREIDMIEYNTWDGMFDIR